MCFNIRPWSPFKREITRRLLNQADWPNLGVSQEGFAIREGFMFTKVRLKLLGRSPHFAHMTRPCPSESKTPAWCQAWASVTDLPPVT